MLTNKRLFNKILISIVLIILIFIIITIYMTNNHISMNGCIKTNNVNEFIVTDDDSSQLVINSNDDGFNVINEILSHSKIEVYSKQLLEYDQKIDTIELKCKSSSKILYTYNDENGNGMIIIVKDFFKNRDTAKKLDSPYYLISNISFSDYYKIFPNSTLLSSKCIVPIFKIIGPALNDKAINAILDIRNDNDCSIKLDNIDYKDKNISITYKQSKEISPHSESKINLQIKVKGAEDRLEEYLKRANIKLNFSSVENINDKCVVSNLEYK